MKLTLLAVLLALTAHAQSLPAFPPGALARQTRLKPNTRKTFHRRQTPRRTLDLAKLRRDADELAALAQSVPSAVDQTTKGVLPKDLNDKLKRIEKLAKGLRSQIGQ